MKMTALRLVPGKLLTGGPGFKGESRFDAEMIRHFTGGRVVIAPDELEWLNTMARAHDIETVSIIDPAPDEDSFIYDGE